ncbi:hypothetical protein [Acinetobacter nectaris]|uniref:hypothetical protein n=1 Tax=Acinetobacter nectaris TaxID=1219382 RepID=UPI0012DB02F3|nr:hypothetical protein [Acinetobacter nectaris]
MNRGNPLWGGNIAKRGLEYVSDRTASEWFSWRNRAALAQAEITKLKQKLEKLESGEFVLMPRKLSENMVLHAHKYHEGEPYLPYSLYESFVEAVEKDHG